MITPCPPPFPRVFPFKNPAPKTVPLPSASQHHEYKNNVDVCSHSQWQLTFGRTLGEMLGKHKNPTKRNLTIDDLAPFLRFLFFSGFICLCHDSI